MPLPNALHRFICLLLLLPLLLFGLNAFGQEQQKETQKAQAAFNKLKDSAPKNPPNLSQVKNAVPKPEPRSRYGNPASYTVLGKTYKVLGSSIGYDEKGIASWYGTKFQGRRTSSGEPYDMYAMTAANKTLPLPTYVQVTNLQNGRQVIVKVNDRGPFHEDRVIDLSYAAAKKLDMLHTGTAMVEVKAIDTSKGAKDKGGVKKTYPHTPKLFLQVAAFSDKTNADKLKARLIQAIQEPVTVKTAVSNDKTLYRVQVGPLKSVKLSDHLEAQIQAQGLGKPFSIVQ